MASSPEDPTIAPDPHRIGLLRSELLQFARQIQPLGQRHPANPEALTDAISSLVAIVHILDRKGLPDPASASPEAGDPLIRDLSSAVRRIGDRATRETLVLRLAELGYAVSVDGRG